MVPTVPPSSSSTQEGQGEEEEAQACRPAVPVRGASSTADARAFLRRAQTHTPRSVRIVSIQDSNAATSATGGAGGHRGEQQGTDRTTTTRVSSTAGVTTTSPPRASSSFFCSLIWSRGGGAAKRLRLVNSRQQHFIPLLRHRMPACVPLSRHRQSSDLRACTSKPCAIRPSKRSYILSMAFPRSRTCDPSDVFRFQCGIYPDRVSRLVARAGRRCRCCVLLNQVYP